MACNLQHVPERLHKDDKPTINNFEVGEELYFRCTQEELDNPYLKISICELSHNRKGLANNIISEQDDVLINITGEGDPVINKLVCVLVIKDVDAETGTFNKAFTQNKNQVDNHARIKLIHEPETCMYPHCVFRVWLNEVIIGYHNYGLINSLKQIKTHLKTELASMIIQKQISQHMNLSDPQPI